MEESTYSVISRGTVIDGFDRDTVKRSLAARFGLSSESAERVLARRRVVLKKGLDRETALRFGRALRQAGLDVALVKTGATGPKASSYPSREIAAKPPSGPPGTGRGMGLEEDFGMISTIGRLPFEFRGTGTEYFKIWMVNTVLSILTLGIYSPWAKVRRKKYLYGSTRIQGSAFEYLADPVKILKGRILVVAIVIAYSLLKQFVPVLAPILGLGFVIIFPWIVIRSLTFNARNSAFRNIRFGFNGSYMNAAKAYVLWPILVPFTLGILFPYVYYRQKAFIVENHTYGTARFSFGAAPRDYYRLFLGAIVPTGLGLLCIIALVFLFGPLSLPVAAVLYFYLFALFSVKTTNLLFGLTRLERHGLSADLKVMEFVFIVFTNTLGIILTLGLFHPWARIRTLRYKLHHLALVPAGSLDGFVAAEQERVSALGEEAGDFLDLDFGL